ncbi:TetR/AcrR family transcriptional regulator [Actinomycetospora sp. TBRC 11914]|uniref:TetR/AcrR family transcriptional regulator n=1 Tax=Actinomycetospora sp. TBRC 11914 TaxID=2729387 RepID=UPI00145C3DBE|nr:TetR/AcrR family transcriptional regulator [Actinomycetospora sp. TBRC 11914]NMO91420.1 TetR/AcrR family transcriptional regulator [Actinomycetospora sp. TBRC 11914]
MRADAVANRRRVLAAAREVFAEQGVEASTEEIARRAGVGAGTVFRHFPTKRDLVEHALVAHFDDLAESARAAAGGDDPVAALGGLVTEMAEQAPTKLAMAGHLLDDGGFGEVVGEASARVRAVVAEILERARATGRVRDDVGVDEIYFLVRGVAQAQAFLPVDPEVRHRAVRVLVDGLRWPPAP